MPATILLRASARYGYGGKQYIARIIGRDPKYTFDRQFVGSKNGKRRESADYRTDEPGLYVTCDIDRKGAKDETYRLVESDGKDGLTESICSKEEAMKIAKLLDAGKSFPEAVATTFPPEPKPEPAPEAVPAVEQFDPCL